MLNKAFMTAGTLILSMMVLMAATQVETLNSNSEHDLDRVETLEGEVVDANTEEGIPDATVYLINGNDRANADSTTTDFSGEFSFEGLEEDSYTLEVEARGYETKEKDVDVKGDRDQDRDRDEYGDRDKDKVKIELEPEY